MRFLTVTCLSIALLQLAVVITSDRTWFRDDFDEIATASIINTQELATIDRTFTTQVVEAAFSRISLGKLASRRAFLADVREFAARMVTDNTIGNKELRALADEKGITIPTECSTCKDKLQELEQLTGKDFDKKYMEMMVADHKDLVSKFTNVLAQGKDADLKSWAVKELLVIRYHLSTADTLQHDLSSF
jgi:putative membrane protein